MDKKVNTVSKPISCECGKMIAVERGGKIFVKCNRCKREIEVTHKSSES